MDLMKSLEILGLMGTGQNLDFMEGKCLEREQVRKAYLKKALKVHPDKQRDQTVRSTEEFTLLHEAYCIAMKHCDDVTLDEKTDLDILMRAFRGEDVGAALRQAGVFQPDPLFGIDLNIHFNSMKSENACKDIEERKERMRQHIEEIFSECNKEDSSEEGD